MANKMLNDVMKEVAVTMALAPIPVQGLGRIRYWNADNYPTALILINQESLNSRKLQKCILKEEGKLDFWNEWEGFFLYHYIGSEICDARRTPWEIPEIARMSIRKKWDPEFEEKSWYPFCAGDFILTEEGIIYSIRGFRGTWQDNDGHWHGHDEIYFDSPFFRN